MDPYVVRPGDYVAKLAARYGFDADEAWNHVRNAELRDRRGSPHLLAPGDVLYFPRDSEARPHRVQAQSSHRYEGVSPTVPVSVILELDGEPVANTHAVVEGPTPAIETTTDRSGVIRFDVPVHLDCVRVRLPEQRYVFELRIGHLDPVDEPSGAAGRLRNLGYLPNDDQHLPEAAGEHALRIATMAFQDHEGLPVSGELDEATCRALAERHGV